MTTDIRKRGLGRGLDALFGVDDINATPPVQGKNSYDVRVPEAVSDNQATGAGRRTVPLTALEPGQFQPRKRFDDRTLQELAQSIREHGVLQPLVVRPKGGEPGRFEIIAGERRWRAAQRARLHDVPVVITDLSDQAAMEVALIENLQREDLNPVDEALGLKRLIDEFGYGQETMALKIGKSRSYVANALRLLQLPDDVLVMLESGQITTGHARALITSDHPLALAKRIVAEGLSVRDIEHITAQARPAEKQHKTKGTKDPDTRALERDLSDALGMIVTLDAVNDRAGKLSVKYHNLDQLDDLIRRIKRT